VARVAQAHLQDLVLLEQVVPLATPQVRTCLIRPQQVHRAELGGLQAPRTLFAAQTKVAARAAQIRARPVASAG